MILINHHQTIPTSQQHGAIYNYSTLDLSFFGQNLCVSLYPGPYAVRACQFTPQI